MKKSYIFYSGWLQHDITADVAAATTGDCVQPDDKKSHILEVKYNCLHIVTSQWPDLLFVDLGVDICFDILTYDTDGSGDTYRLLMTWPGVKQSINISSGM